MNFKKEIENVLNYLKSQGHDRAKIEGRLGYAPNAIDQSLARGGSNKLLCGILLYKDAVLNNSIIEKRQHILEVPEKVQEALYELAKSQRLINEANKIANENQQEAMHLFKLNLGADDLISLGEQSKELIPDLHDANLGGNTNIRQKTSGKQNKKERMGT